MISVKNNHGTIFETFIERLQRILTKFNKIHSLLATKDAEGESRPAFINDLPSEKELGHLIHLQCGHNGFLSHAERRSLKRHLKTAGFII